MAKRPRLSRRIGIACAMITGGVVALSPEIARSQDAPPPIDVPTEPVPQVNTPITPGASTQKAPPPPPPKPAPAPTTTSTSAPAPAPTSPSTDASNAPPPIKYNNEGTLKVGGVQVITTTGSTSGTATVTPSKPPVAKTTWKPTAKANVGTVAQWPGFRMTDDGGSEVMVELSKATAAPTEHKAAGSITYLFKGVHVTKYNNENPLLTKHFNTPVFSAKLVPKGWDLLLVIEMRAGVDATPVTGQRVASDNVGQQFFVKFAKGSYLPPDDDVETKLPTAKSEEGAKGKKAATKPPPPAATTTTTPGGSKMGPKP